ncbi:MAG: PIN domain-containing protein [Raoultibacter sp.]
MKALVDSNVIIDFLSRREPFYAAARKLMLLGFVKEVELWISASQVTDILYVLTGGGKPSLAAEAQEALKKLRSFIRVCSIGEAEIDALLESAWDDLEDASIHLAACKSKADYIVTRNGKDFTRSTIKVVDAAAFIERLEQDRGCAYEEVLLA